MKTFGRDPAEVDEYVARCVPEDQGMLFICACVPAPVFKHTIVHSRAQ